MCLGTLWEECCDCVGENIILLIYDTTEHYNICCIVSVLTAEIIIKCK